MASTCLCGPIYIYKALSLLRENAILQDLDIFTVNSDNIGRCTVGTFPAGCIKYREFQVHWQFICVVNNVNAPSSFCQENLWRQFFSLSMYMYTPVKRINKSCVHSNMSGFKVFKTKYYTTWIWLVLGSNLQGTCRSLQRCMLRCKYEVHQLIPMANM